MCLYVYIYIYVEREREREREKTKSRWEWNRPSHNDLGFVACSERWIWNWPLRRSYIFLAFGCLRRWWRLPEYLGHGTSVPSGVSIALDGQMLPSIEGKVGAGCYCFACKWKYTKNGRVDTFAMIEHAWERSVAGKYNSALCRITLSSDI